METTTRSVMQNAARYHLHMQIPLVAERIIAGAHEAMQDRIDRDMVGENDIFCVVSSSSSTSTAMFAVLGDVITLGDDVFEEPITDATYNRVFELYAASIEGDLMNYEDLDFAMWPMMLMHKSRTPGVAFECYVPEWDDIQKMIDEDDED